MKLTPEKVQAFAEHQPDGSIKIIGQSVALFHIDITLSDAYKCSNHELLVPSVEGCSTLAMWVYGENIWQAVLEMLDNEVELRYEGGILYAS